MPWGISTKFMWLKLKEWADQYGDVYQIYMMGINFIVVSDEELAKTLLVNMGNINSDRPKIQSLFDSKSDYGSKLYLPLMGRNGMVVERLGSHGADCLQMTGPVKRSSLPRTSPKQRSISTTESWSSRP